MAAVAGGEVDVTADVFRAAIPVVYGYLVRRCGPAVAEDLTQETFLAAVAAMKSGTREASTPQWLVAVARNKLVDHLRRKTRTETKRHLLAGVAGDTPWGVEAARDRAVETLLRLPPSQRAALMLRYMDGLPVPEVARLLKRSVHATESLLARGRDSFRRLYVEEPSDA